jgi:lysophospholipase L1-like esterase
MRWAGNLLLLVVASFLSLAAGEIVLRLVSPAPWLYPLDASEDTLMIPHPQLGYALRPGAVERWTREHWSVHVEINEDGLRDAPLATAHAASLRAIAVGDSFTFGIGVEQDETWPEVLQHELAWRTRDTTAVVNAGVPAYSARQMRLRALELLEQDDPALVVAGFYARSYWRVQEPYTVYGGTLVVSSELPRLAITARGDLVLTPFQPGTLRDADVWLKGHLHLPARAFDALAIRLWPQRTVQSIAPDRSRWTDSDYQPALDELAQLHAALSAQGIPMVLLLVNHQDADGSFSRDELRYNEHVARFCRARDLPLVDPLPRFVAESQGKPVLRTPSDMHWTPLAHRIAAQEVMRVIEAQRLLPLPARAAS